MTDDAGAAFDAVLRQRAGVRRTLTLTTETDDERATQAAFGAALAADSEDPSAVVRRLFGEPAAPDEGAA